MKQEIKVVVDTKLVRQEMERFNQIINEVITIFGGMISAIENANESLRELGESLETGGMDELETIEE